MSTKYEADRFPKMLLTEHSFGGLKTSQKMTAVASLTCPGCGRPQTTQQSHTTAKTTKLKDHVAVTAL